MKNARNDANKITNSLDEMVCKIAFAEDPQYLQLRLAYNPQTGELPENPIRTSPVEEKGYVGAFLDITRSKDDIRGEINQIYFAPDTSQKVKQRINEAIREYNETRKVYKD